MGLVMPEPSGGIPAVSPTAQPPQAQIPPTVSVRPVFTNMVIGYVGDVKSFGLMWVFIKVFIAVQKR